MTIINKLYKVQIDCSTYEPLIDSTDTTITVTVFDFNNQIVSGATIPVSVDKGYFTKYTRNGTDTNISGTSTKSYTGVTGSDGTFTLIYTVNDWGFVNIQANNNNVKLYVQGWRRIPLQYDSENNTGNIWISSYVYEDSDPFPNNKYIFYDDNISVARFYAQYSKTWQQREYPDGIDEGETIYIIGFSAVSSPSLENILGSHSLPEYIFPTVAKRVSWYRPDCLWGITSNQFISFRCDGVNATPDSESVYMEWSYMKQTPITKS